MVLSAKGAASAPAWTWPAWPPADRDDLARRSHGLASDFQQVAWGWCALPMPVIAAVHGVAFGGGLQIASGADVRIAAPGTRLSVMEMKWGMLLGATHRSRAWALTSPAKRAPP